MPHDVFISYSSADKPVADALCAGLEARGLRCWIAPRDITPGVDWGAAIIDAITEARVMVLVFSSSANQSKQIKREVERAVAKGVSLIPLRIEDVPLGKTLEYFISSEHWMDALSRPLEPHVERLAAAIRALLARPSRAGDGITPRTETREESTRPPEPLPISPPALIPAPPPPPPPSSDRFAPPPFPAPGPASPYSSSGPAPPAAARQRVPLSVIAGGVVLVVALYFLYAKVLSSPPPQILSVQFPQQIGTTGRAYGTVFFRAPKADLATARFNVLSAVNFPGFSFPIQGVAGKREGAVSFYIQSPIPQHITLKAVLIDRRGHESNPVPFGFDVQAFAAAPPSNAAPNNRRKAPNGFRFNVPVR